MNEPVCGRNRGTLTFKKPHKPHADIKQVSTTEIK